MLSGATMLQLRPRLSALLALALPLLVAAPALAEAGRAPPRCGVNIAPRNSNLVPANLPAIAATPAPWTEGAQRVTVTGFGDIDGGYVEYGAPEAGAPRSGATAIELVKGADLSVTGGTLFVPDAPFEVGKIYRANFAVDCAGVDGTTNTSFTAGEPSPLPTTLGTVSTRAGTGSVAAEVYLDPTPELRAFLPVTKLDVTGGGAHLVAIPYGEAQLGEGNRVRIAVTTAATRVLCEPGWEGSSHIEPMRLTAHVAGAESDPPSIAFDVAIDCTKVAEPDPLATDDAATEGGCSASPDTHPPSAPAGAFAVAAVAAAMVRRRRAVRAARRSSP